MSKAIDDIKQYEYDQRLACLSLMQDHFSQRYGSLIQDERDRDDFRRDLIHLIHLTYREAQEPLVKQLTDFVMTYQRPILVEKP